MRSAVDASASWNLLSVQPFVTRCCCGVFLLADGANEMGDNLAAVDLNGLTVLELQAYNYHNCVRVLVPAGTPDIYCWGSGQYIGTGNSNTIGDNPGEMGAAMLPTDLMDPSRGITSTVKLSRCPTGMLHCNLVNSGEPAITAHTNRGSCTVAILYSHTHALRSTHDTNCRRPQMLGL